jgi:hypothetical protein
MYVCVCVKTTPSWQTRLKAIFRATNKHATNLAGFVAIYKILLLLQRKLNGGKQRTHDTFFAGLLGGYFVFGERNAINEQVRVPCLSFTFNTTHTPAALSHPFSLFLFPLRAVLLHTSARALFSFLSFFHSCLYSPFFLFFFFKPLQPLPVLSRFLMLPTPYQIVLYVCSRVVASFLPRAGSPRGIATTGDATVKPIPPDSGYFSIFAAVSWGAVMWLFQHRGETLQPGMFSAMTYLYRDSER